MYFLTRTLFISIEVAMFLLNFRSLNISLHSVDVAERIEVDLTAIDSLRSWLWSFLDVAVSTRIVIFLPFAPRCCVPCGLTTLLGILIII